MAGHPYVLHDAYMGCGISDILKKMGHKVLYTDYVNRESALKKRTTFQR